MNSYVASSLLVVSGEITRRTKGKAPCRRAAAEEYANQSPLLEELRKSRRNAVPLVVLDLSFCFIDRESIRARFPHQIEDSSAKSLGQLF